MTGPVLVGQFWGLDSDRILKLVLREIILSQASSRMVLVGLVPETCLYYLSNKV